MITQEPIEIAAGFALAMTEMEFLAMTPIKPDCRSLALRD